MKNDNARIYGPPAHKLDSFSMNIVHRNGAWVLDVIYGHSQTHRGVLWELRDVASFADDDSAGLNLAQESFVLVYDMIRDLPGTQERAQFVASGGLYEQLPLF